MTDFTAWTHHTSVTITGSTDGALTNYPVPVTVAYQSFMNMDFSDVRFTLNDGTELSYSLESYTASSSADFLVQVPSLPASPATTTIIIYAGNPTVTTTSDPDAVYDFNYDPTGATSIDINKWDTANGSDFSIDNGLLKVNSTTFGQFLVAKSEGSVLNLSNFVVEAELKSDGGYDEGGIFFCGQSNPSASSYNLHPSTWKGNNYILLPERKNGNTASQDLLSNEIPYTQHNTFFKVKITCVNDSISISIDNGTPFSVSNLDFESGSFGPFNWGQTTTWYRYIRAYKTTVNPPTTGTIGEWTLNDLIILTPPIQSNLTIITPQIAIGGEVRITTPPIRLTNSINIPTPRAILTSPPITVVSSIIPPVIAFLMEVKAGVTYNPDAINDLKEDGIPANISFNVTIGDQQYE